MAAGIFRYYTLAEVQALLTASKSTITGGGTVVEYSIGGRTIRKEFALSNETLMEEINWALNFLAPLTYPDPFTDRTLARF